MEQRTRTNMAFISSNKTKGVDPSVVAASQAANSGALDRAAECAGSSLSAGAQLNVAVQTAKVKR
jgi:hypothetical protein